MDPTAFIVPSLRDDLLFRAVQDYFFVSGEEFDENIFEETEEEEEEQEEEETVDSLAASSIFQYSGNACNALESNIVTGKPKRKRIYKKRKRFRKKDPLFIPRVLKRDLRRQFPIMMVNVFNSHDYALTRSFFLTFSSPSLQLIKNPLTLDFFSTNQNNQLFRVKDNGHWTLHGPDWIIYHWHVLNRINPDQVIKLEYSTIHTTSGTTKSKISFVLEIRFTRIFDIEDDKFVDHMFDFIRNVKPSDISSDLNVINSSVEFLDPFDFYVQKTGVSMPLLRTPQYVRMRARASYYFDENKHIEMVEITDAEISKCDT
jgi:hypothetical protein